MLGLRTAIDCVVPTLAVGLAAALAGCSLPSPERRDEDGRGTAASWVEPSGPPDVNDNAGGGIPNVADFSDGTTPRASESYVFVANPQGRSVVVIDSTELTIRSIDTGNGPSYLETVPGENAAIVLNVGSGDASIVRVSEDGALTQQRVDVVRGANRIEVAPDGRHAVVLFDASRELAGEEFGEFQSVSVIALSTGSSATMTVGFKPERVVFQEDGTRAFVITEEGISVLDFAAVEMGGSGIAPAVQFGRRIDGNDEVIVTPDGRYALAHPAGSDELRLLDLELGTESVRYLWRLFPTPGALRRPEQWQDLLDEIATDEPLTEKPYWFDRPILEGLVYDAAGSHLTLSERRSRTVLRLAIPGGFDGSQPLQMQAVSHDVRATLPLPGSDLVLAYRSNAGVSSVSIVDFALVEPTESPVDGGVPDGGVPDGGMAEDPVETYDLRKGVRRVFASPDGQAIIIQHDRTDGDPNAPNIPLEQRVARAPGHTLLRPLDREFKLQSTSADIDGVVFSPDSTYAFLRYDDPKPRYPVGDRPFVREVHRVDLARFLTASIIQLDSAPVSAGALPGQTRVFVSQDHPDGRLAFIDWTTGEVATVTGFEINSRVQN